MIKDLRAKNISMISEAIANYDEAIAKTEEEIDKIDEKYRKLAEEEKNGGEKAENTLLRDKVTEEEIARIIERWTGIPVAKLMEGEKESEVTLDRVLMIGGEAVRIGAPVVEGAKVTAKIVDHVLGDKVVVFKHKRRKAERTTQGHRQKYTVLTVTGIVA